SHCVWLPQVRAASVSGGVWLGPAESGGVGSWFGTGLPDLLVKGGPTMAIRITDDTMTLEIDHCVVATARFSEHAAADGNGAWIVSTHPALLLTRDQVITALTVAELGESGYSDSHLLVVRTPSAAPMTDRLIGAHTSGSRRGGRRRCR